MQSYYISQSNSYTFRIEPSGSNEFTMSLQNMITQENTTASMTNIQYEPYESMLSFTASLNGVGVGDEFRATLLNHVVSSSLILEVWHGTWQVFPSQSVEKSEDVNQNTQYKSHISENKYVIMD